MLDVEHLTGAARDIANKSADERIAFVRRDRWIGYPRADQVLTRLDDLMLYPQRKRMPDLLLWGESGMGKTQIVEQHVRRHPPTFDERSGVRTIPVLTVEMPALSDPKWFFAQILVALGAVMPGGGRVDTAVLATRTVGLLRATGVRMMIFDEVHSLLAGSYRSQRTMLNLIRQIANELRVPIICVGTQEARDALLSDPQMVRRFGSMHLPRWLRDKEFYGLVATILRMLPLRRPSPLGIRAFDLIHKLCGGITSQVFYLLTELAVHAIRSERELIRLEDIRSRAILDAPLDAAP